MKTADEVKQWAMNASWSPDDDGRDFATAKRIARALVVLEVVEEWDDDICDAFQYGKCGELVWEALRAALDGDKGGEEP